MSDAPTAHIDLKARTAAFKMQISSVKRMLVGLRNTMSTVSRHARRMLVIGGAAITGLLVLAGKQADAEAILEAALKATGGAAGYTAAQLKRMAAEMQKVTRYGDEAIMPIQALLLTFKEIKGPVFKDVLMMIADMATVMGTDLKGAALQLGKALNDPYYGMSLLSRVGIIFSEQQKKLIRTLWESNQRMKAQGIMLDELAGKFGGAAQRAAQTFMGRIVQLKNALSDVGETLGFAFVPEIMKLTKKISNMVPRMDDWVKANKGLIVSTAKWVAGIGAAIVALGMLTWGISSAYAAAMALGAHPILAAIGALAAGLAVAELAAIRLRAALRASSEESKRYAEAQSKLKAAQAAAEVATTPVERAKALRDAAIEAAKLVELEKARIAVEERRIAKRKEAAASWESDPEWVAGQAEHIKGAEARRASATKRLEHWLKVQGQLGEALETATTTQGEQADTTDTATESAAKFIEQLERQRDMLGKTGMEAALLGANIESLNDAERTLVKGIYAEIDAWEAAQEAEQRAYDASKKDADSRISSLDRQLALLNKIATLAGKRTEVDAWRDELIALGATNAEIEKEIALRKELYAAEETERKKKEGERQREFKASFVSLTGLHRAIQTAAAGGKGGAAAHAATTAGATKGTQTNTAGTNKTVKESKTILQRILDEIIMVKEQLPLVGAFG